MRNWLLDRLRQLGERPPYRPTARDEELERELEGTLDRLVALETQYELLRGVPVEHRRRAEDQAP